MAAAALKHRWFRLSPDRFVIGLLLAICLLWLSERFKWFGFNQHKGWTVLIAVAAVGVAGLGMLLWWIAGLVFRWRFQLGVRTLFGFCLAVSIAAAWLATQMNRARRQRDTLEALRRHASLWVGYDWQLDAEGLPGATSSPPATEWLQSLLGADFFSEVAGIERVGLADGDASLGRLKRFANLRELWLSGSCQVTDAGAEQIGGMSRLEYLSLEGSGITDSGMAGIARLSQLQCLNLNGTRITDGGLDRLGQLTHLEFLGVSSTGVTSAGVATLQTRLPRCQIEH